MRGTSEAQISFIPLCAVAQRAASPPSPVAGAGSTWAAFAMPLSAFGAAAQVDELRFVTGPAAGDTSVQLLVDDVRLSAARPLVAGDHPPSYGRLDPHTMLGSWLQGRSGAASAGRANNNEHLCEYMTSELGHSSGKRPLCRMDGDHLDGRWMQTCDPRTIRRPDLFAYGQALPAVSGWYDYRLCWRQSATEWMRTTQAISWSWRPKGCALAPISGAAFDQWLGKRMLLLVGDSLMGQLYYSLLWQLGDAVLEHKDVTGVSPEDRRDHVPMGERTMHQCESSVGNEGGWLSMAKTRSGGRVVKVMRHTKIVKELQDLDRAWWSRWLAQADILVLNIGHHYHSVDSSFVGYGELARLATRRLERLLQPHAQVVFRTTNVGHHACENATRPLRSREDAWKQLTSDGDDIWAWKPKQGKVDMFKDKYNWRGPPLFEHEWAASARDAGTLGSRFTYLNVSFLDARADGHVATSMRYSASTGEYSGEKKTNFPLDCLHYCYPGPTDFWALSLYNLLLNNERFAGKS